MAPPLSFLLFPDVDLLFMELFVVEEVDGEDVSTTDVVVTIIVFGCWFDCVITDFVTICVVYLKDVSITEDDEEEEDADDEEEEVDDEEDTELADDETATDADDDDEVADDDEGCKVVVMDDVEDVDDDDDELVVAFLLLDFDADVDKDETLEASDVDDAEEPEETETEAST